MAPALTRLMKVPLRRLDDRILPLLPSAAFILLFLVLPLVYITYISFRTFEPIVVIGDGYTLAHYLTLVTDPFYQEVLIYTVRLAFIVTVLTFVIGYPLGYFMARTTPLRRTVLLFLVLLPLMIGTMVRIYGWITIFGRQGLINNVLFFLTGQRVELLGTTPAVVVGLASVFLPFVVLPVFSAVEKTPRELELAARNLGANSFQAFYKVTFRLSLSGAVTGSIFVFAMSMSSVVTPKLLGGRTDNTMGSIMYDVAMIDFNWPRAGAIAVVLATVTLTIIFAYLKLVQGRLEVQQ